MKLPLLLAQYLYKHKTLSLPEIGILVFDGVYDDDKSISSGIIQFTPIAVKSYDEELIQFIRMHTKKMQPLIYSDLDAFIAEIKEFTNIGNPCYVEGIGTFRKNRSGVYEFSQGEPIAQKLEDRRSLLVNESASINSPDKYYVDNASRNTLRSLTLVILLLAGLGGICWGGYYLYTQYMTHQQEAPLLSKNGIDHLVALKDSVKHNNPQEDSIAEDNVSKQTTSQEAMQVQLQNQVDSQVANQITAFIPEENTKELKRWKYVLRKGDKDAVEKRYLQLKGFRKPVIMEATQQSGEYIVYLLLDVAISDTLRIKDSLRIHYNNAIEITPFQ